MPLAVTFVPDPCVPDPLVLDPMLYVVLATCALMAEAGWLTLNLEGRRALVVALGLGRRSRLVRGFMVTSAAGGAAPLTILLGYRSYIGDRLGCGIMVSSAEYEALRPAIQQYQVLAAVAVPVLIVLALVGTVITLAIARRARTRGAAVPEWPAQE